MLFDFGRKSNRSLRTILVKNGYTLSANLFENILDFIVVAVLKSLHLRYFKYLCSYTYYDVSLVHYFGVKLYVICLINSLNELVWFSLTTKTAKIKLN